MANRYDRALDPRTLGPSEASERSEVLELGAFSKFRAQVRVLMAGGAGTIRLQEAAVNEPSAFVDLAGTTVNLNAVSNTVFTVAEFLRYVRWITDGAVAGGPSALIDIVAKD